MTDSCEDCLNGTCVATETGVSCVCDDNWFGEHCGMFDHCASAPCLNGGTCENSGDDFECHCAEGFCGDSCAHDTNC